MAAYFANIGYSSSLYAREPERVEMFPKNRVFNLKGIVEGNPVVDLISCSMRDVIADAHLIMVTTPAQYHHNVAADMAPFLQDGQIIVLNPGRTFGTYVFKKVLESNGCTKDIIIAEAETFVFACRCTRVAQPYIHGMKKKVMIAAHNPTDTNEVVNVLEPIFPGIFRPAPSVMFTSFSNIGMIFHPLPILLNITRVEAQEKFYFYTQGISPLVANIIERLDRERVDVANMYGVKVLSAFDWINEHYGSVGDTLYERIQNTSAYSKITAPVDIDTRYIYEDILTGCVPMYYAARTVGLELPVTNSIILWASTIYSSDFKQHGRGPNVINFDELVSDSAKKEMIIEI